MRSATFGLRTVQLRLNRDYTVNTKQRCMGDIVTVPPHIADALIANDIATLYVPSDTALCSPGSDGFLSSDPTISNAEIKDPGDFSFPSENRHRHKQRRGGKLINDGWDGR